MGQAFLGSVLGDIRNLRADTREVDVPRFASDCSVSPHSLRALWPSEGCHLIAAVRGRTGESRAPVHVAMLEAIN